MWLMYMQLSNVHIDFSFTGHPTKVMTGLGSEKVTQLVHGCSNKCSHYHSALTHKGWNYFYTGKFVFSFIAVNISGRDMQWHCMCVCVRVCM